jgi:hypothetical protein
MNPFGLAPPSETDLEEVMELNLLRAAGESARRRSLEEKLSSKFAVDQQLAVYGSLAPGRANAKQLEALAGEWRGEIAITGTLVRQGWGAKLGFRALRWTPSGPKVPSRSRVTRPSRDGSACCLRRAGYSDSWFRQGHEHVVAPISTPRTVPGRLTVVRADGPAPRRLRSVA